MSKIKIFILTHGDLCNALSQVLRHMLGDSLSNEVISVPLKKDMSRDSYYELLNSMISNEETIFFTDIPGGTPDIIAKMIVMKRERGTVISGVNLPMLINLIRQKEYDDPEDFVNKLIISGKNGIQKFNNKD
ncbi:PTS sugar transporter subunit IIA [bacterium]|nr:PTS sugar transporter subunit IIA [bacterium]